MMRRGIVHTYTKERRIAAAFMGTRSAGLAGDYAAFFVSGAAWTRVDAGGRDVAA